MAVPTSVLGYTPFAFGAYDYYGNYVIPSNNGTLVGNTDYTEVGSYGNQISYAMFDAAAIEAYAAQHEAAGDVVHVDVKYTLNADLPDGATFAAINLTEGYYTGNDTQSVLDSQTDNNTGIGHGYSADIYNALWGTGETTLSTHKYTFTASEGFASETTNYPYSQTVDISNQVQAAAAAGADLVLALVPIGAEGTGGTGSTSEYLESPIIQVIVSPPPTPPEISGTASGQVLAPNAVNTPFAGVAFSDPANPGGTGYQVTLSVLDAGGNGTDAYGVLTTNHGDVLNEIGAGQYTLGTVNLLSDVQTTVDDLQFHAAANAPDGTVTFEIDLQSPTAAASNSATTITIIEPHATCFLPGTRIAVPGGEVVVEALAIGDLVLTAAGMAKAVKWVGRRSYAGHFIAGNHLMLPICITAGALGPNVPRRDLHVSPGHGLYLDGVLVPAWRLVNGVSITQAAAVTALTYLHVELEGHDVIRAEGAAAESFLDDGCRGQFHNAADYRALYPAAPAPVSALERVEDGFQLQGIQCRVAWRAGIAPAPVRTPGPLRGYVDQVGPERICGWAQDVDHPEVPVCLEVLVDGHRVCHVLANGYRSDLRRAGLGSGCHAFSVALPNGYAGALTVRRATDRAALGLTDTAQNQQALAA
jgi:hypothetical protein